MNKDKTQILYLFVRYIDAETVEKKKRMITITPTTDLKVEFKKTMHVPFNKDTCYIKPVIRKEYKDYTSDYISAVLRDAAYNLVNGIKNEYAVADDLLELAEIMKHRTVN